MAWWDDVVDAVSSTVDAVADVVEGVANEVGEAATDIVETVGNGARDGLNWVSVQVAGTGGLTSGAASWLGGVVAGATNLVGAAIKGVVGIAAGALAGAVRVIGGLLTLNFDLILKGLIDIGASVAGAVLVILGQTWSLVQRIIFLQNNDRTLTKSEKEMLRRVFFNSLALYNIRVIEGWSGCFGISGRPFTLGNTVYMQNIDLKQQPSVLVHECVHVWQYQNVGARYTADALGAQLFYGGGNGAYDWQAELARGRARWWDFNEEAQAEFIQNVWDEGTLTALRRQEGPGGGVFYKLLEVLSMFGPNSATAQFVASDGIDHTTFAFESITAMRERINARWSHAF